MKAPSSGLSLAEGLDLSGMTIDELWIRQISVGGNRGSMEVEAYMLGLLDIDRHTYNLLAQALNEHFIEQGLDHPVGYSD
jgi:hypothetical protein